MRDLIRVLICLQSAHGGKSAGYDRPPEGATKVMRPDVGDKVSLSPPQT